MMMMMIMARHDQGCTRWLWGRGESVRGLRAQNGRRAWAVVWVVPAVTQACVQHPMHHLLCHQHPALIISWACRTGTLGPEWRYLNEWCKTDTLCIWHVNEGQKELQSDALRNKLLFLGSLYGLG